MADGEDILSRIGKMVVLGEEHRHLDELRAAVTEPPASVVCQVKLDGIDHRCAQGIVGTKGAEEPHVLIGIRLGVANAQQDIVRLHGIVGMKRVGEHRIGIPTDRRHGLKLRVHRRCATRGEQQATEQDDYQVFGGVHCVCHHVCCRVCRCDGYCFCFVCRIG